MMTFLVTLFSLRDLAPERSRFSSQLVAGRTLKMDTLRSYQSNSPRNICHQRHPTDQRLWIRWTVRSSSVTSNLLQLNFCGCHRSDIDFEYPNGPAQGSGFANL